MSSNKSSTSRNNKGGSSITPAVYRPTSNPQINSRRQENGGTHGQVQAIPIGAINLPTITRQQHNKDKGGSKYI